MQIKNITIGADPECFVFNTEENEFASAIGYIPGTKEIPYQVDELGEGFAMQTDNILAEFNIPASKLFENDDFIVDILSMKNYINEYLEKEQSHLVLKPSASQFIPEKYLNNEQACLFGCDPDYNAYNQKQNKKPELIAPNFRSSGFHIHIGYDNPMIETSLEIIKYLDAYVGIPSIILDKDKNRRTLYGKAGCFRFQRWGVEWRVLSGAFLQDEKTVRWVQERVRLAIEAFLKGKQLPPYQKVVSIINKSNAKQAIELINEFNLI